MKVLLVGKNSKKIKQLVRNLGFEIVSANPDVVISFGGDGTLLYAEREYPSIPKLPIRDSQFCHKCPQHKDEVLLKNLLQNKGKLETYQKVKAEVEEKTLHALNDFAIRNLHPTHAIRFKIHDQLYIGDGIVVSSQFGSTAYFKSITGQTFNKGFALAFNNTTEKADPIFLEGGDKIKFELVRGVTTLTHDNSPDLYNLEVGSSATFTLSDQVAKIYESSLRCPKCQVIRG